MKNTLLLFGFYFLGCGLGLGFFMNGLLSTTSSKLSPVFVHDLLKDCHPIINNEICHFLKNMSQTHYYNHNQKIVIILIDALRADFIPFIKYNDKFNLSMPYTEMLLKNRSALSFVTKGFAPTVTLPRIKTLLTGAVSNFIDILLNFNAFELDDDNILKQASTNGYKSVFYGDDTWLKMFPNLFIRSEGTHSFFVSDFKEVDFNVSRHIKYEMERMDWNILILHFLGVDHIGHSHGPFSEHLLPKLIEMDNVVKFMHEKLTKLTNSSLIVLCGDHGMTSSGSHGGITQDELLTPLVFIHANHTRHVEFNLDSKTVLDQIDFAATFSAILGIPIPSNSYGQIIFDALKFVGFSNEEILYAAYINLLQICKVYESIFPSKTGHLPIFKETVENHYKWFKNQTKEDSDYLYILNSYERLIHNLKNDLLSVISVYDDFSMILGILIMYVSVCISFYTLFNASYNGRSFKNVYPYKMTLTLSIALPIITFSYFYLSNFVKLFILFLSVCFMVLIYQISFLLYNYFCDQKTGPVTGKVMVYCLIIHTLSLFSSSFIEEEHQTWYYLACSFPILVCLKKSSLFATEITNQENMCKKSIWTEHSSTFVASLAILILHRIFCKWNQVGNKWLHMPDITDWLNLEEHIIYLGILTVIAQFVLTFYFRNKLDKLNYIMFNVGLLLISIQKLDDLVFFLFLEHYTKSVLIPWTIYLISAFITVSSLLLLYRNSAMVINKKAEKFIYHFISAWILLVEVIGRVHNIPLIVNVMVQEYLLNHITWRQNCNIITNVISYFIMAMTSFFYHGNSNSLSTIDVFAGYTGIQTYKPVFVGFLIICNTYSTFLMWLMLLFCRITHTLGDLKGSATKIMYIFLYLLDYKLIVLLIYCTVMFLMRHHLFIFSVFFPKLFYEVSHVLIVTALFIFVCFIISIL